MLHRSRLLLAPLIAVVLLLAGCGGSSDTGDTNTGEADTTYADDMAEQHEGDRPSATAAAREPMMPVDTRTVSYATTEAGESILGYVAEPERPDSVLKARGMNPDEASLPGVVVIHEWWGLNDNIRTAARRIAGEGYRVLAVDLYDGSTAETPKAARELMQQAMKQPDRLAANLERAHAFLREELGASRTAVMGWCFGGSMTMTAAITDPKTYDAAVVYYGRLSDVTEEEIALIEFPILGFFGGQDSSIPVESVREFEQMLDDAGKDAEFYVYDDAGHAFANPSGTNYDPEAAADAWEKTTAFLKENLYETDVM